MTTDQLIRVFRRHSPMVDRDAAFCIAAAHEDAQRTIKALDVQAQEYAQAVLARVPRVKERKSAAR